MNIRCAAKDEGLKNNIVEYMHNHDQDQHIQRQIIRIQTGNQRRYVLRDQRVTNANHKSDDRSQKRNGIEKSGKHANRDGDSQGNPEEYQSQRQSQAHQKTFQQGPAQIPADSIVEFVKNRERQLKVTVWDEAYEKAADLSVIETQKDKN